MVALLLLAACVALRGTGYHYRPLAPATPPTPEATAPGALERLRAEQKKLLAAQRRAIPQESYVVIDQTNNRLYVKRGGEVLIEAVCSAGSGMVLREAGRGRSWVFDTPRGAFRVLSRLENPVWRKPDWAFVEEGRPIPRDPTERFEYGTLGEYALYFGDGYMVHGTLYERLLGRSVTHGCIRLGRDDLRAVWKATRTGTPIFIY